MTPRRDFLRIAAGATALSAIPGKLPALDTNTSPFAPSSGARELLAASRNSQMQWDTTWVRRLTGTPKVVFDAPELEMGLGVVRTGLWIEQHKEAFKSDTAASGTALVIRHNAIPLIMNDAFWQEYGIAKSVDLRHPFTGKKLNKNPGLLTTNDDIPPFVAALMLDKLIGRGVPVLACNLAFDDMVALVARKHKLEQEAAYNKAKESIVPGVILQPSGVFAVVVAEDAGCHYARAS